MICPECNTDLTGPGIYDTFIEQGDSEEEATETEGTFDRQIGVYDLSKDMTVEWMCPDCKARWPR
jgi:hypothetical protein